LANLVEIHHKTRFISFPHLHSGMVIPCRAFEWCLAVIAMVSCLMLIEVCHGAEA
jgi:hypothetical protein